MYDKQQCWLAIFRRLSRIAQHPDQPCTSWAAQGLLHPCQVPGHSFWMLPGWGWAVGAVSHWVPRGLAAAWYQESPGSGQHYDWGSCEFCTVPLLSSIMLLTLSSVGLEEGEEARLSLG